MSVVALIAFNQGTSTKPVAGLVSYRGHDVCARPRGEYAVVSRENGTLVPTGRLGDCRVE